VGAGTDVSVGAITSAGVSVGRTGAGVKVIRTRVGDGGGAVPVGETIRTVAVAVGLGVKVITRSRIVAVATGAAVSVAAGARVGVGVSRPPPPPMTNIRHRHVPTTPTPIMIKMLRMDQRLFLAFFRLVILLPPISAPPTKWATDQSRPALFANDLRH